MSKELEHFNNFVIFKTSTGKVNIDVFFKDENLWLTQKKMSELFEVDRSVITKHISNIFEEGELDKNSTSAKIAQVQTEGSREVERFLEYYNLKVILAVGYRVNSQRAIEFRSWASDVLKEYIIKGFAMDDERLKQIKHFGIDYFQEQLERIREIRASERRFYQKITDIYSLSADYDKNSPTTKEFFATVQNKLHYAITGKTAAEIIYTEADATKLYMGLKTWKNAPDGKILKSDVLIAKNYLNEQHIKALNRIVSAYIDLAENRAERQIVMNMKDWAEFLNQFLELSNYPILLDSGKMLMLEAKIKAETEFEQFRIKQDKNFESDFDKFIKNIKKK
jgi:hypothetical protein